MVFHVLQNGLYDLIFWLICNGRSLHNKCLWNLASRVVWNLDHSTVGHSWMRQKVGLKLGRGDLMAFDLDQLLDPINDYDVLVSRRRQRYDCLVTRPHPSPIVVKDKSLRSRLLVVEVADVAEGVCTQSSPGVS